MQFTVYTERGIRVRDYCGAEPKGDFEPAGFGRTVGWRVRAPVSYGAGDGVQAPAGAPRGRFRRIHGGRTAPSLPAEARTTRGSGCVAGSLPPILVRPCGCSRTPPRPHGCIDANER